MRKHYQTSVSIGDGLDYARLHQNWAQNNYIWNSFTLSVASGIGIATAIARVFFLLYIHVVYIKCSLGTCDFGYKRERAVNESVGFLCICICREIEWASHSSKAEILSYAQRTIKFASPHEEFPYFSSTSRKTNFVFRKIVFWIYYVHHSRLVDLSFGRCRWHPHFCCKLQIAVYSVLKQFSFMY